MRLYPCLWKSVNCSRPLIHNYETFTVSYVSTDDWRDSQPGLARFSPVGCIAWFQHEFTLCPGQPRVRLMAAIPVPLSGRRSCSSDARFRPLTSHAVRFGRHHGGWSGGCAVMYSAL